MRIHPIPFALALVAVLASCSRTASVPRVLASVPATAPTISADSYESLESFLQRYWGDRWTQVRPNLRLRDCDWKAGVRASDLAPWSDVARKLEQDFTTLGASEIGAQCAEARRWTPQAQRLEDVDLVGAGLNPANKTLREQEWKRIHEILAPYDSDLNELGRASADQFVRYTTKLWREEKYWRSPFAPLSPPPNATEGKMLMVRTYTAGGWHVSFTLHRGDDPLFDEIWRLVGQVADERAAVVKAYIESV